MKFKDYINSLVSKRKSSASSSKSHHKHVTTKNHQDSQTPADCHYDICGYEDVNGIGADDQHSRTQILLARHAQLVNTIVGTRSPHDGTLPSCSQCRISHQPSPMIPPPPQFLPPPPPLPPKLSLDQHMSFSNRNYSSTLATCSPRRECQQQQQQPYHQSHLNSSQYSTPNPSAISSSSSSLWTTTASLSKKQRSKIRTNPWIGNTSTNNRSSTFIESSPVFDQRASPPKQPVSQPEYDIYDSAFRTIPSGLIHSESFPQTISNGNNHITNPPPPPPAAPAPISSIILHQSDSGHGFSLSSSRVIDSSSSSSSSPSSSPSSSSSSPNNTSSDGVELNDKQHYRQRKLKKKISSTSPPLITKRSPKQNNNTEQYFSPNTIASDGTSLTRRTKSHQISPPVTLQYRYQRPSDVTKTSPVKSPIDRRHPKHHSRSSSSHSIDDHFSLEFEEILENERSYKQRKDKQPSIKRVSPPSVSPRKSPFILPLDETNIKLSSPPPIVFSPTLTKANSRAILKHIEEIENEIRLIKNLDLANDGNNVDDEEYILSPHAYPEDDIDLVDENNDDAEEQEEDEEEIAEINDGRQSIYEQVDQWVEKCLKTTSNTNNPATLLHNECDHLSNTIKDYVVCACSNDDRQSLSIPTPSTPPPSTTKLMTAFYLSSMPIRIAKRTSSFIDEPLKLEKSQTVTHHFKSIHECPF